jgi:hypothetical protein
VNFLELDQPPASLPTPESVGQPLRLERSCFELRILLACIFAQAGSDSHRCTLVSWIKVRRCQSLLGLNNCEHYCLASRKIIIYRFSCLAHIWLGPGGYLQLLINPLYLRNFKKAKGALKN